LNGLKYDSIGDKQDSKEEELEGGVKSEIK